MTIAAVPQEQSEECITYLRAVARLMRENPDTVQMYALHDSQIQPAAQVRLLDAFLIDPKFEGGPRPKRSTVWSTPFLDKDAKDRRWVVSTQKSKGREVLCCIERP